MTIKFTHQPGLVAYITCGDPSLEVSRDVALAAIEAGADVIELGVPFSDPVADGPVIQRASERALAQGTDLAGVIDIARQIRQQSKAGLIIFSYLNPILQFGLENSAKLLQMQELTARWSPTFPSKKPPTTSAP